MDTVPPPDPGQPSGPAPTEADLLTAADVRY